MNRRTFITVLGGTGVAAGAYGVLNSAHFFEEVPPSANAPWRSAGTESDPRRAALSFALLAPNPHNRQPWLVDLSLPSVAMLHCDTKRLLPETDPFGRQVLIGHGCFLELASIAAKHGGMDTRIELFPDGAFGPETIDERPVARLTFRSTEPESDPLFPAILKRRTFKEAFETRLVAPAELSELASVVLGSTMIQSGSVIQEGNKERSESIKRILREAWRVEARTPRKLAESVDLMRIGSREIAANPDGIDLGGPLMNTLGAFGLMSREALRDPNSKASLEGERMYMEMIDQTPAFVWLTTEGDARPTQIESGRAYARLALQATLLGLSLHPMSQALQEYPEMSEHYRAIHALLDIPEGHRIQMLARVGYGRPSAASPRRYLESLVLA